MEWDWNFVWEIMPTLIQGVKITILATLLGSVLAAIVGLAIALARRSPNKGLSRTVGFLAEFIRGTPLLVQLYFIFYVLPDIGILLPPLVAGVIGLGLHYGTYTAEVYRAGIENVPRGQWEAAKACNLNARQTWTHIIIP
ncbi:MAG: ectoine/hydroxyectoine ABC transporter permease subunit EhuD, partial [Mesorhizobium sp.]